MASARLALLALLLLGGCAPALAGTCAADSSCTACNDNSWLKCTGCESGYELSDSDGDGEGFCYHADCEWDDSYAEDWYSEILIGSIVAVLVTAITTTVVSLPVCCGVMKDLPSLKVIAIVCSVLAAFCFFVPMIAGAATSGGLVDDICDNCQDGCTDAERDDMNDHISALGVFVAYTYGFGFIVLIVGGITMCLSCCVCCPCCGPLKAKKDRESGQAVQGQAVQGQAVQGQVVGQQCT